MRKALDGDSVRDQSHQWKVQRGRSQRLQPQAAPEPENHPDPGGLSQPAGLRLPPADAGHFKGGSQGLLHRQQHRKIHLILSRAAQLHL